MRHCFRLAVVGVFALTLSVGRASAGDVTVKNVHLCCGACVSGATKALKNVPGVTSINIDRNSKLVRFTAKDAKTAQAAINSLAKSGFHGSATHDKQPIAFPKSGVKKGQKADIVTFTGLHLCCGGCVAAAQKAVRIVPGVTTIEIDRNGKSLTLKGKAFDLTAAVAALHKGGFHGTVKKSKK